MLGRTFVIPPVWELHLASVRLVILFAEVVFVLQLWYRLLLGSILTLVTGACACSTYAGSHSCQSCNLPQRCVALVCKLAGSLARKTSSDTTPT
jgi:hypothetical protein